MLLLLVATFALSFAWFAIGRQFLSFVTTQPAVDSAAIEWTMLLGAFVLAVAAQAIHFALPLPPAPSAIVTTLVFALLIGLRRDDVRWLAGQTSAAVRRHPWITVTFLAMATLVALAAARPCKIEDTENYHAQIIRWTASARLVPGLALVHGRLGFNSLWFSLETVLSFAFLSNAPLPIANTTTFMIGLLYLFRHCVNVGKSRLLSSLAIAALVPYVVAGFLYAGSQSPDLPALTCGLLTFFAAYYAFETSDSQQCVLAMCLAVASVCWKLSALPLLLFVPLLSWNYIVSFTGGIDRTLLWTAAFCVVAGAILIARSVVLSGYPFFPSTMFDIFPVDWRVPALAHGQELWIRAFARGFRTEDPIRALGYPVSYWVPIWVRNWNNTARVCLGILALGAVLLPVALFVRPWRRWLAVPDRSPLIGLFAVALLGTCFWFWQAPDVRFGASYLIALTALVYLPWTSCLERSRSLRSFGAGVVTVVAMAAVGGNLVLASPVPPWCSAAYAAAHPNRFYWVMPAPYPVADFVDEALTDGTINHVVASGGLAHYGAVPNSPLPIAGIAVHRGPRLSDGYRVDTTQ